MSFACEALYLVEPRPELAVRLREQPIGDLAEILLETRLFRHKEGGHTAWRDSDWEAIAKLLFLVSLMDYAPLDEAVVFCELFESKTVSIATFDRWFQLRRFEVDENLDNLITGLRDCHLDIDLTGQPVADHWLASVRTSKDGNS